MYHIGLIQHVISPQTKGVMSSDDSVQAVVKMWDENVFILRVSKKLSKIIKKNDYVITDYTPLGPTSNNKKLLIIKILPKEEGSSVWVCFQDQLERRRNKVQQMPPQRFIR